MRRLQRLVALLTVLGLMSVLVAVPASAHEKRGRGHPVYLALGDSWAYGQGATDPADDGYVAQFHDALREDLDCRPDRDDRFRRGRHKAKHERGDDRRRHGRDDDGCKRLRLVNLGRPATETLPGVTTQAVAEEQLPFAIPMLERRNHDRNRRNDVAVISLHVGGNDAAGPIQAACIGGVTPQCIGTFIAEMATYEADLRNVVGQLRAAAGESMPIILGTYDNPVPFCDLGGTPGASQLGAMLLEGTPDGSLDGVHDVVRRVAADYGAEVAEVFGRLAPADFVGGADCLHPSDTGYDKVTDAFRAVIDD